MIILGLEAYRRRVKDGPSSPVKPVPIEPQPALAPQVYLLHRILQAGLVHWHILEDRKTAEELFRIVEEAYFAGQILAVVEGRTLQI